MRAEPDLLISRHELTLGIGSEAADMRAVAAAVGELGGRLEATLNIALANAEMGERLRRDGRDTVEAIAGAMAELAGFFEHAAAEVEANDALPLERERDDVAH